MPCVSNVVEFRQQFVPQGSTFGDCSGMMLKVQALSFHKLSHMLYMSEPRVCDVALDDVSPECHCWLRLTDLYVSFRGSFCSSFSRRCARVMGATRRPGSSIEITTEYSSLGRLETGYAT